MLCHFDFPLPLYLSVRLTCAAMCALVYIKIETGTCTSHGYKRLANADECGAAAKALSGGGKGFSSVLQGSGYAACYYYSTNAGIFFGSGTHSIGQDGETPCNVISGNMKGRTAFCYCSGTPLKPTTPKPTTPKPTTPAKAGEICPAPHCRLLCGRCCWQCSLNTLCTFSEYNIATATCLNSMSTLT